jgi:hypothetical protein
VSRRHDVADMQKLLDKLKRQLLAAVKKYDNLLKKVRAEMKVAKDAAAVVE